MRKPSSRLGFIEPAQPVLVDAPPTGEGWIHEVKQDGFRTELVLDDLGARAFSRSGLDWSERYPAIVSAMSRLRARSAILDGEMIVPDAQGRSDFHAFARAIKSAPDALVFIAFDLLWLDGEDLRALPLTERRQNLEQLIAAADDKHLVFSRAFEGEGRDVFAAVEQLGLEGHRE